MSQLTALLSFAVITSFTPGPNNIMAMSIAGQHGQRQGLRFCLGVLLGFLAIMTACALGSATLCREFPWLEQGLRVLGSLYMLWMAWGMFHAGRQGTGQSAVRTGVVAGMLLQFVNPKVIAFGMTVFAMFVTPYYTGYADLLLFALLLSGVGFAGTYSWSLCGGLLQKGFARYPRGTNMALALLMVGCALSLFL